MLLLYRERVNKKCVKLKDLCGIQAVHLTVTVHVGSNGGIAFKGDKKRVVLKGLSGVKAINLIVAVSVTVKYVCIFGGFVT